MGEVFDVTKGARHYGKGGSYSFFTGRDGSRAFTTGDFKDGLTDDLNGLKPLEVPCGVRDGGALLLAAAAGKRPRRQSL